MLPEKPDKSAHYRAIKSFVLRQGRLTKAQQHALQSYWQDYGVEYSSQPISFEAIFGNNKDVILEIGFGNGESLLKQAAGHPQTNFLGIEVHAPGVGHLIHHANSEGIRNIRVIRHDAVEVLKHQIPEQSLQRVQLFFPDPWHKKRHHKRRIISDDFIRLIHRKLKPGGLFHIATDWEDYAWQILERMDSAQGFNNTAGGGQFANNKLDRSETRFERRGIRLGHIVRELIYEKQATRY